MAEATGMVSIHAHTILRVTPHLTAENLLRAPTPIIAPVMVCVVLTGTPKKMVMYKAIEPDVSAQKPSNGLSLVIRCPIVLTILHPPNMVPIAIAAWHISTTQKGIGALAGKLLLTNKAIHITPIVFWASLPPCPRLNAADDKNCNFRKTLSILPG